MLNGVLDWVSQYGYAALFGLLILGIVGLPVPDETLLMFSGYLISRGRLHPVLTFFAGFLGSVCGISISYAIGRTVGHTAVLRYGRRFGLTARRLERTHIWFQRAGEWLLAFGYFIPGVRHFTALVAGTSELEFFRFARMAWFGAAVWVAFFLFVGYWVGEKWRDALALVEKYTLVAVVLCGVAMISIWCLRRKRSKL
jgi:membrane protein DedA with SNARE-associated domain